MASEQVPDQETFGGVIAETEPLLKASACLAGRQGVATLFFPHPGQHFVDRATANAQYLRGPGLVASDTIQHVEEMTLIQLIQCNQAWISSARQ